MSFKHGKDAAVYLGGANISPYLREATLNVDVETADTTTFGSDWKRSIAGLAESTLEAGGYFDPTFTDLWNTLGDADGKVLTYLPSSSAAVGDVARLIEVKSTSYAESAPVGDVVAFSWGVMASGDVGFGHVLHELSAETADANGDVYDGGAATTDGAVAHLHVTSVSSGDVIDVTIEDSADGSTGWATIGTFAQVSAAGAERITINGTVKRYVRAVWNITDDGSPSITFAVALARL